MNTDELKLVLETIGQIADGGTTAAIVWMVLHYVAPLLQTVIVVGGVAVGAVYIARIIAAANSWVQIGRNVATAYGATNAHFGSPSRDDREAINKAIGKSKGGAA